MSPVRSALRRVLREPLLHFLVIGTAIFGLYGLVHEPTISDASNRIVVTANDVDRLRSLWEKRHMRPPTADELAGLIEEHVREEVLYREALALGLDRDDSVIRRHLSQKLEFVTEDLAAAREPDAGELAAWFAADRERYRTPTRLSFTQVYFNLDRRGAAGEREARLMLASLRDGTLAGDAVPPGDGRLLDATYRDRTVPEVAALFGSEFAEAVSQLDPGTWSGPIPSGYGLHLVRLDARMPGAVPPFAEVEDRVRFDWADEQRRQTNEAVFKELLARYDVVVEGDVAAGLVLGDGGATP